MPTVREDIAQVRKSVNSLHTDTRMPNKFIYDKILTTTKLILRREAEIRKIYKSTELFFPLDCIDMETLPATKCTNIIIPNCTHISRSIKKLPEVFNTPTGSIINIYDLYQTVQFFQTNTSQYINISKREYKAPQRYYWIENDYLYIPGAISKVMAKGIFIDNAQVEMFNNKSTCYKLLDAPSFIPQWLREDVLNTVINNIAGVTKRIPEDENVNSNTNEIK